MASLKFLSFESLLKYSITVLCHLFLFFGIIPAGISQTEPNVEKIQTELVSAGFENVFSTKVDSILVVGYENRRFRFEPRGCSEVIRIVGENVNQDLSILLILYRNKIPMLFFEYKSTHYHEFVSGKLTPDEFLRKMKVSADNPEFDKFKSALRNKSQFKADVAIGPQVKAQFGNFDRPVQANINLVPELNTLLAKGLTIKTQMIVPIYNNYLIPEQAETEVRPGILAVNQIVKLEDQVFFNASAGFFTQDRAGIDLELKKYFGDGNFAIGLNTGYTVYHAFVPKQIEYYEDDSYFTGLFTAEYRFSTYDLTTRIQAGNFLYNDLAARFDLLRQFGEVNIGFFASISESSEVNGGFNFAIPLPPGKYMKFKYMRLRQTKYFSWEYRAKGFVKNATTYDTGNELYEVMLEYNPIFFKKRLIKEMQ